MTVGEYFLHYISFPDALWLFVIALALIIIVNFGMYIYARIGSNEHANRRFREEEDLSYGIRYLKKEYICNTYKNLTQKFYELFFSCTSILLFITVYYLVYRFYEGPLESFLDKYSTYMLLLLIVISCVFNAFLDKCLIKLTDVDPDEISPLKILGMVYMLLIFVYVKFIYENDNYDMYITYFLGLMIGRFVYFDASFKDFTDKFGKAIKNIPILLIALACTGAIALYGFKTGFFIKHIGVITNVCIGHLFTCIAIIIVYHFHPEKWLAPKE